MLTDELARDEPLIIDDEVPLMIDDEAPLIPVESEVTILVFVVLSDVVGSVLVVSADVVSE